MALGKRSKNEIHEVRIKDWYLTEKLLNDGQYFLDVMGILQVYSYESAEECRKLLRAIVNTWLNLRLARDGISSTNKELWNRERKLYINYRPYATFEWSWKFQEAANAYNQFEGRQTHNAMLVITGNIWKFESQFCPNLDPF